MSTEVKLYKLFESINSGEAKDLTYAKTGLEFEDRFEEHLRKIGFSALHKDQLDDSAWQVVKQEIVAHTQGTFVNFFFAHRNHFVKQPYGTQSFPDFIIAEDDKVRAIELKFGKNAKGHPVWNGGLPRPYGIYVFGNAELKDVTFFRGLDILSIGSSKRNVKGMGGY